MFFKIELYIKIDLLENLVFSQIHRLVKNTL